MELPFQHSPKHRDIAALSEVERELAQRRNAQDAVVTLPGTNLAADVSNPSMKD